MSAAAATSIMIASQHGSSISPIFALITAIIVSALVIYLGFATIYYGGKDKDKVKRK
jgi:uncharacterized BrkB/YihY/UPF0761 family membrane protein